MAEMQVCRLCLADRRPCILLKEQNTAEMLEVLTAHKIAVHEKISSSVCLECYSELKLAYDIRQKFLTVETEHQEVLLADFLIENHDELVHLVQREMTKLTTDNTGENNNLTESEKMDHPPFKYKCDICPQKFEFSPDFVEHLRQHVDKSHQKCEILCEQCGGIFDNSKAYSEHKNTTHPRKVMCDICSQICLTKDDLDQHVNQTHSDLKQFICDVCNQRFSLRYILQAHKLQHKIHYPFGCEQCGREFKYEMSLNMHQKMAHEVKEAET